MVPILYNLRSSSWTTQEVDLFGPEDAFVVAEDETSGTEAFKEQIQVAPVFFGGRGEDKDVVNVGDTEGGDRRGRCLSSFERWH